MRRVREEKYSTDNLILFDFDHTIYGGNSAIDYYVHSVKGNPALLVFLPYQLLHLVLYILRLENKDTFKGNYFIFIKKIKKLDQNTEKFWKSYSSKIYPWYINRDRSRDVIVSASPSFYLDSIAKFLGVKSLICTQLNISSSKIVGTNCYGEEKVKLIKKIYPNSKFVEAYTDSHSDLPMLELAEKRFMVKNGKITEQR